MIGVRRGYGNLISNSVTLTSIECQKAEELLKQIRNAPATSSLSDEERQTFQGEHADLEHEIRRIRGEIYEFLHQINDEINRMTLDNLDQLNLYYTKSLENTQKVLDILNEDDRVPSMDNLLEMYNIMTTIAVSPKHLGGNVGTFQSVLAISYMLNFCIKFYDILFDTHGDEKGISLANMMAYFIDAEDELDIVDEEAFFSD